MKYCAALTLITCWIGFVSPVAYASSATLIIESGSVQLRRENWSQSRPTYDGVQLGGKDLIRPDLRARVLIQCPGDERLTPVPSGVNSSVNSLCNTSRIRYKPGPTAAMDSLEAVNPALPYVIVPRVGALLDPTPTIRWNPVSGARSYTVRLESRQRRDQREPDQIVWQEETDQSELEYPGDPALEPGQFYRFVVEADTGEISADDPMFTFNPDQETQDLIEAVEATDLPAAIQVAEQVRILQERGFTSDATMVVLKGLDQQESADLYRQLGDLYGVSGLSGPAREAYQRAIEGARFYEDLEVWMLAHLGLGELYDRLGEEDLAVQQYRRAAVGALYFCDPELLSWIAERVGEAEGERLTCSGDPVVEE